MRGIRIITAAAFCAACIHPLRVGAQTADGLVQLFDGTLNGWVIENTDGANFSVRDGVLRVEGPGGWLRSAREYADFQLRVEFRFVTEDADSGVFFRTTGGEQFMRGWPNNSYQVQIRNPATASRLPPVGALFRHGTPPAPTVFDPAVVQKVVRPTGEWQALEITVVGNRVAVRLNGTEVMHATEIADRRGHIGVQGETGVVEFRSIAIREQGRS